MCSTKEYIDAMYEECGKMHVTFAQKPTHLNFERAFVVLGLRACKLPEVNE
jgi:hypothetical protein